MSHCTQRSLGTMTHCVHITVEWSNSTSTLTHFGHRANKPLKSVHQTNAVVPETVTFAVEPENRASFDPR